MSNNKLSFELEVKANQVTQVFDYLNKELNKMRDFLGKPFNVDADVEATRDYYQEKERLEYEASLSGMELFQYKLEQLQAEYDALGELDAENVEAKLDLDKQMLAYKRQIATEERRILAETKSDERASEEVSRQAMIDSLNSKILSTFFLIIFHQT